MTSAHLTSAQLAVRGIEAGYGDVQVLWGIDLDVRSGEIVCVIGSNGAGKSTLLRAISGLVRARAGSVAVGERDLTNAGPKAVLAAGVAHVPEGRRLFSAMSVEDNLKMGAYLRHDHAEVRRDLAGIYETFPILGERRRQDAGTLSGGEQQMCAIGRGIMGRPRLLMIDELSLPSSWSSRMCSRRSVLPTARSSSTGAASCSPARRRRSPRTPRCARPISASPERFHCRADLRLHR
jgi:branched-chain amino acid transport system ATP-binding protein